MNIIPAIDLLNNQCVRLTQGDFNQVTVYSNQPEEIAYMFQLMGARQLHIIDLDGANQDDPINMISIRNIIQKINIPIQVGGGIRTLERAKMLLDLGVERIIIGTAAIENLNLLETLIGLYGHRIIVSIDAHHGIVKTRGWKISSGIRSIDLVKTLEAIGVQSVIYTDISKDGMLEGPNLEMYQMLRNQTPMGIIASGGITTIDDLKSLKALNLEGAIVGKAYYEKKIDLKEAFRCLQDESSPV
jgi:phosphoribosylformimino-5-aminoimidazole carboxamide ribotide isomerase